MIQMKQETDTTQIEPNVPMVTTSYRIPEDLRRSFRIRCVENGVDQQDVVRELMEVFIERGAVPDTVSVGLPRKERQAYKRLGILLADPVWRPMIELFIDRMFYMSQKGKE